MSVKKTTIEINGKEYGSVDDVPEDLKYLVEDKDEDGMPDHFEKVMKDAMGLNKPELTHRKVEVKSVKTSGVGDGSEDVVSESKYGVSSESVTKIRYFVLGAIAVVSVLVVLVVMGVIG